ncbi:MAG: hypothetical protein LH702_30490 [Phormidesmis sp. CAN_BIN44]|nr:hypothetical protein [Phormidesmis sp. CAN_BIN44]
MARFAGGPRSLIGIPVVFKLWNAVKAGLVETIHPSQRRFGSSIFEGLSTTGTPTKD